MNDLRLPLGLLLAFYGIILIVNGAIEGTRVLGVNVNLWWGAVLLLFGAAMLCLARRAIHTERARTSRVPRADGKA
jgi:hypothetical protein